VPKKKAKKMVKKDSNWDGRKEPKKMVGQVLLILILIFILYDRLFMSYYIFLCISSMLYMICVINISLNLSMCCVCFISS
jgi:hypothetical protein